jgi:hypothetical protein
MTDQLRQAATLALDALTYIYTDTTADEDELIDQAITAIKEALAQPEQQAEPVSMRMPKVGDKVICLEDESLGEVVSLTGGGSPDITFDDGTRGTYLLREFAELFGYVAAPQQQAEPVAYFDFQEHKFSWAKHMKIGPVPMSVKVEPMKLYSESTKRQWVGLTDEEFHYCIALKNTTAIAEEVEAKLKERNT